MRRIRLPLTVVVILLIAGGLVVIDKEVNAPPEDNGIAGMPPPQAFVRAIAAARAAPSVHVVGGLPFGSEVRPLDMRFKGTEGATGSVTPGEAEVMLTRIGPDLYVTPKSGAFAELGEAGKLLEEITLKYDAAEAPGGLGAFTRWEVFLGDLFQRVGTVRRGTRATINGVPAIALVGAGGGAGTLYVATSGVPYPVRLVSPEEDDRPAATLDFLGWTQPVELTVPPNVLDTRVLPGPTPSPATVPTP